jgi:DNA-binding NtrC family response regulator
MQVAGYQCKAIRSLEELSIDDQQKNFNVIISDILFDGIAPLNFVFQISEVILHKELIIVTKMGQRKVQQEILSSGNVKGFFAVPFDMDNLQTLVA